MAAGGDSGGRDVVLSRIGAEKWGLGIFSNLEIKSVAPGSPADRAGLVKGEIISRVDGQTVKILQPVLQVLQVCCDVCADQTWWFPAAKRGQKNRVVLCSVHLAVFVDHCARRARRVFFVRCVGQLF